MVAAGVYQGRSIHGKLRCSKQDGDSLCGRDSPVKHGWLPENTQQAIVGNAPLLGCPIEDTYCVTHCKVLSQIGLCQVPVEVIVERRSLYQPHESLPCATKMTFYAIHVRQFAINLAKSFAYDSNIR